MEVVGPWILGVSDSECIPSRACDRRAWRERRGARCACPVAVTYSLSFSFTLLM